MLSLLWVVQLPSYSHMDFPGRSEHGGTLQSPAVLLGNCGMEQGQRTILQRLVLAQCPHSANILWILSPWVVCSVFSLGDAPSVYSRFHGRVFPSSVVSMVFVVEKQLCVAPCSPCAISFLWCSSSPALPCLHLFQGLNLCAVGVWKSFLRSSPGIISTNRLERGFLWHRTVSFLRESPFLRMLRLATTNEQIALRKVGGDQILAPS